MATQPHDKSARTVIVIQARMGSTRLPGKVLKTVDGRPLLDIQLERVLASQLADDVIVAVPDLPRDDLLVDFCDEAGVACFRGSESDVLGRFRGAAEATNADAVVRLTADCPVVDPQVIDRLISRFWALYPEVDYVSNTLERTYPRGLDAEVFSRAALEAAAKEAIEEHDREHVTPFLYRNPERFQLSQMRNDRDLSHHRWTVDTPEDFALVRRILEALSPRDPLFTLDDAVALVEAHPEWSQLNAHIEQK